MAAVSTSVDATRGADRSPSPGDPPPPDSTPTGSGDTGGHATDKANVGKIVAGVVGMLLVAWLVCNTFLALAYYNGEFKPATAGGDPA